MSQDDPLRDVMGMLSEEQIRALRDALSKVAAPAETASKRMSEDQLKAIRSEINSYREAQRQTAEAIGVLWNARLDLALHAGDMASISDALQRPIGDVAFYDNCSCGGGGGGGTGYW